MASPTLPRQRPESEDGSETTQPRRSSREDRPASTEASFEGLIEEVVQTQVAGLERELEALREQVEEIDDFARISLNERKIKQSEENLSEFSDSLMGFAEKAFNDINDLEDRLDMQALLLAAILDALGEEDVELDLSVVDRYRRRNVVVTTPPEEQLEDAIERS
jgi:TolA-binding protein